MHSTDIHAAARQLLDAHGNKAIAEAAQKAVQLEKSGQTEQAQNWRQIETALKQMVGPRES